MMDITKDTQSQFEQVIKVFEDKLKTIHTGLAHPGLVENVKVNHYNAVMPLKQLASILAPSPHELVVHPWDPGALQPIETALVEAGQNYNPVNDGKLVRINLPPLSGERRSELKKLVSRLAEEAKVGLRTIREESWRTVKARQKASQITEDDMYSLEKELNNLIHEFNSKIEDLTDRKIKTIEA